MMMSNKAEESEAKKKAAELATLGEEEELLAQQLFNLSNKPRKAAEEPPVPTTTAGQQPRRKATPKKRAGGKRSSSSSSSSMSDRSRVASDKAASSPPRQKHKGGTVASERGSARKTSRKGAPKSPSKGAANKTPRGPRTTPQKGNAARSPSAHSSPRTGPRGAVVAQAVTTSASPAPTTPGTPRRAKRAGNEAGLSSHRKNATNENKFVMTLFHKGIHLAAITPDTSLYGATRAWMANDTSGKLLQEIDAQGGFSGLFKTSPYSPTPGAPPPSFGIMKPPTSITNAKANIDRALSADIDKKQEEQGEQQGKQQGKQQKYLHAHIERWKGQRLLRNEMLVKNHNTRYGQAFAAIDKVFVPSEPASK